MGERIVTTRFNVAELYVGVELATLRAREANRVETALRWLPVLEFDDAAARVYAKLLARLRTAGGTVADMDMLIASVALAEGHSLVTANARHFTRIPGLAVHSY